MYQLLEFIINSFTDGVRGTEVHWSAFYFGYFSCWNGYLIYRSIEICVDCDDVVFYCWGGIGSTCQIKESVVGQVYDSRFVGSSTVFDDNCILFFFKAINHFHFQITGEALFSVCRSIVKPDHAFLYLFGIPNSGMKSCGAAMK